MKTESGYLQVRHFALFSEGLYSLSRLLQPQTITNQDRDCQKQRIPLARLGRLSSPY